MAHPVPRTRSAAGSGIRHPWRPLPVAPPGAAGRRCRCSAPL